jgi:DNA adenine methylase
MIECGDNQMSKKSITPLRYAGGKSRAIDIITGYLREDAERKGRIVSPFAGGCSLEIYWADNLRVDEVVAYDIFKPLVNFWNVILTKPNDLADALSQYKPTKEYFTEKREYLKSVWNIEKEEIEIKDEVEQASLYYYNHQCSYGPMFLGWPSSVYLKQCVYDKIIKNVRDFRCPKLKVRFANFLDSIPNHKNDFLYLDPPYYEEGKMFKALYPNCNFPIHHRGFPHEKLRDLLYNHKEKFALSYNSCPTIKEWYAQYKQKFPKWHYSYQQGEKRIGKNRIEAKKEDSKKKSHEILILNVSSKEKEYIFF